ncbi:MAG: hypothetical protein LBU39_06470 [Desulfobulbaceae bacterium]|jgi:hypothetical protein|nr:hypothetical protein [Desulfobulbaceae bacterium]
MKKYLAALIALAVLMPVVGDAYAGDLYDKKFIKSRARQGECSDDDNDCINVTGNKAYSYQQHGYKNTMDREEKGNIEVSRDGKLAGDDISKKFRKKTIKEVHQYVNIHKDVDLNDKDNRGNKNMEVGAIKIDAGAGRKVRQVENIVEVARNPKNADNVTIGAIEARKGASVGEINNQVTTKGVNADGRVNIGGVRVGDGATVDQIHSDTTVNGDIQADGPINIGGVRVTNGTIGSVHTTTTIKGSINATGN